MSKYELILTDCQTVSDQTIMAKPDTEDTVKGSEVYDVIIDNCDISGGKEDCLDIVRGSNIAVKNTFLTHPGKQFVTLKGGVKGAWFDDCSFFGKSEGWMGFDVILGGHQIYGMDTGPCKYIEFVDCRAKTPFPNVKRRKLRVLVLHSDRPTFTRTPNFTLVVPRLIVKFIFWLNRKKNL